MEKPIGLEEHTVQYFLKDWNVPKVNEMIEKCKIENGKESSLVKEWKYIKWRMIRERGFIFR